LARLSVGPDENPQASELPFSAKDKTLFSQLWEMFARDVKKLQAFTVLSWSLVLAPFLHCHGFVSATRDETLQTFREQLFSSEPLTEAAYGLARSLGGTGEAER
jgi:hypothetical protein